MTHTPQHTSTPADFEAQFEQFAQSDQTTPSTPALSRRELREMGRTSTSRSRGKRRASIVLRADRTSNTNSMSSTNHHSRNGGTYSSAHGSTAYTTARQTILFLILLVIFSICGYFVYQAIVHHQTPIQAIEQRGPAATLTIATTQALSSLDIQTDNNTAIEQALLNNVYETLLRKDQHNNAGAGIAQSWSVSDDGLTYTFQLRQHITFSNGDTLDANDVVWSLQQVLEHQFIDSTTLQHIEHVAAPDAHTITITLRSPNPELPWELTGRAGIVYDQNAHIDYKTQAIGSGPFMIADGSFHQGQPLTLTYNPNYWGTKAQLGSVTLKPYSDATQAIADLRKGTVQAVIPVGDTGLQEAQKLAEDQTNHITLTQGLGTGKLVLGFNNSPDSLFSDQAVRNGARFALNTKDIAASQHNAAPLSGPLTQLDPGYTDLSNTFPYDLASARSKLSFFLLGAQRSLVYPDTISEQVANTIADQLRAVGFSINVERVDTATWQNRIANNQFDLTLYYLPDSHDFGWYVSSQNPLHFTDSQSEHLYAQAMSATNNADYEQSLQLYAERLNQQSPVAWLYQDQPWVAWRDTVTNMPTNMVDQYLPLAQVSLQQ